MISYLKFVVGVVLCKDSSEEIEVVGLSRAKCVHKLLSFCVLFSGLFPFSLASKMHS